MLISICGRELIPVEKRFWNHVRKSGEDQCWEWIGAIVGEGYGRISRTGKRGKYLRAHRLSWEIHNGPIPKGLHVLHSCDNPPCVNPKHLFLGTDLDNTQDAIKKGRVRKCHGEEHYRAILTEKKVLRIRRLYREGRTQKKLAKIFGVHSPAIYNIVHNKNWKHVK